MPLEDHVNALLKQLGPIADRVRATAEQFRVVVWAAVYSSEVNATFSISPESAKRLAGMGIGIDFDLYLLPKGEPAE